MPFTADLRVLTSETWEKAITHKFVEQLWTGKVPESVSATYFAQDFLFGDAFVALMGGAISNADEPRARMAIARQLGFISNDEDDFFLRALKQLGQTPTPPAKPTPSTQAFLDLMNEARKTDYASALVVLLVAEWLYLEWADQPDRELPEDWISVEWIELHRGDKFEKWVQLLQSETDRVAAAADEETRARMKKLFERAVNCELAFFDAAYL